MNRNVLSMLVSDHYRQQILVLVYILNLVFDARIMECYHVFEQMMLYRNLIQLFAQFQRNLQRDPKKKIKIVLVDRF